MSLDLDLAKCLRTLSEPKCVIDEPGAAVLEAKCKQATTGEVWPDKARGGVPALRDNRSDDLSPGTANHSSNSVVACLDRTENRSQNPGYLGDVG